jgi:type II secretory ATPase GspE/PulE/Tfp pilus assembly ATPase PilB-like protein
MSEKKSKSKFSSTDVRYLREAVNQGQKLQEICHKIYGAKNLDALFINLEKDITDFFNAERFTVYCIDGITHELVSRFKSGEDIRDIRLPVSSESIAGFAALRQRVLNVRNVQDKNELSGIDPKLQFDDSWDRKSGYDTRQVLAAPIRCEKYLMGAMQIINCREKEHFSEKDEAAIRDIGRMFGIALYTQKRIYRKRPGRFEYLLGNHLITKKLLEEAVRISINTGEEPEKVLMEKYKIKKEDIGRSLSEHFKVPFVGSASLDMHDKELVRGMKPAFMTRNVWFPWRLENGAVQIAIDDPNDLIRVDEIRSLFPGKKVKLCVALKQDILKQCEMISRKTIATQDLVDIIRKMHEELPATTHMVNEIREQDSAVIQLVNKMIMDAFERGASDIHVEPFPGRQEMLVRIRIDGRCQEYGKIPAAYKKAVVSRIKIMADLDISEKRRPQDGKIDFEKFSGKSIELRVATIPTQGGMEDVVMRIVSAGKPLPLKKLNFSERNYDKFLEAVEMPYGLIFVSGPTGSGKTTTLHAALRHLNRTERKIWTAEDPVEITQPGLRQVQVRSKINFGFAQALRSFLRADPDIIMVGEMRDRETTRIGIEASLTGHLVLSTLHTNNAPETITRLLDLGMDPFHFADAMRCILAQRLVPTLCGKCKEAYHPGREEFERMVREYGAEEFERRLGIRYNKDLILFRASGCTECGGSGYRGRVGIHELLMATSEIKRMIQTKQPVETLRRQAEMEGMSTLKQDGIEKIFKGHCDLIRVRKVCIQ